MPKAVFTCRFHLFKQKILILVLPLLSCMSAWSLSSVPQDLQTVELQAGLYKIKAMAATTAQQRNTGLMFRKDMKSHEGMLFIFDAPAQQCFWMKNTLLPLSAAFIQEDGTIVNVADMQPQTLESHCSKKPVRFVLEMNKGWFQKRGLKEGNRLKGAMFQP
jgi:uncharacterized protein